MSIVFTGATGLVGRLALPLLLQRLPADARVLAVGRRAPDVDDARVLPILGELHDGGLHRRLDAAAAAHPPKAFICALGTTARQAGSQAAFAAVDRDAVVALAERARVHGAQQAIVVSSLGADSQSGNFYLRIKGEMQAAVAALGFSRVDFLQPGLLLGPRGNDHRPAERIAQMLAPLYNPLLRGGLYRYRAIPAATVAAEMVALLGAAGSGITLHRNEALLALASGG